MHIKKSKHHCNKNTHLNFGIALGLVTLCLNTALLVASSTHPSIIRTLSSINKSSILEKEKHNLFKNWGLSHGLKNSHISAPDAWKITKGSQDVLVAVVDTGIDPNHVDLKANIWSENSKNTPRTLSQNLILVKKEKRNPNSSKKNNRKKSQVIESTKTKSEARGTFGWDFVTNKANPMDDHGHGTHVAGIIGAVTDTKAGISGVSPQVSILAVKYYSDSNTGKANLDNTIKAINYAVDKGARIINYSGGGPQFSQQEYLAMKNAEAKGVLIVAAAGNEKQNIDIESNYYFPSAYTAYGLKNIISVAAIDIENNLLKSSNWGAKKVDVAAPGENIYSTLPGNKYGYLSGTSQATAFVTGLAALLLSKDPTLTPEEIRSIIISSVDKTSELKDKVLSNGKINAYKALLALQDRKKKSISFFPNIIFNEFMTFAHR